MNVPTWKTEFKQVAPKVYSYIQGGGPRQPNMNMSNASVVIGDDALLVVDTLQGPIPAKAFLAGIRQLSNKPIRHVVNTHSHPDHTLGNQYFTPAEFIMDSEARLQGIQIGAATANQTTWNAQPGVAEGGEPRTIIQPDMVIGEGIVTLYYGKTKIELHTIEHAHSFGDIMVYIPEQKVLLAGDICFFYVTPTVLTGTVARSLKALDLIDSFDADIIVPGHGPVGGKQEVKLIRDYFKLLTTEVKKRFDAGMNVVDAAASIDLGEFDVWSESEERLFRNALRYYYELQGKPNQPVSLQEANAMMVEYQKKRQKK